MINGRIGLIPEVNFKIVKGSRKRGTLETVYAKNVVLDIGFEHFLDRLFTSHEFLGTSFSGLTSLSNRARADSLYLGTGTTEPSREDLGLEAVSTTVKPRVTSSSQYYGVCNRDPVTGVAYAEVQRTHSWGEGAATGTWTEAGLAFWDLIGTSYAQRGEDNTYTFPYSRSLFRKGLEEDFGTASAGGATTLSDATKAWDVDAWKDNYTVYIVGGTGTGQSREITGNTATELTVSAWDTQPDATSEYRIKGTPQSITVLEDEFLTIFSYQRMYMRHEIDAWSGVATFFGAEVPWTAFVNESKFVSANAMHGNMLGNNWPHTLFARMRSMNWGVTNITQSSKSVSLAARSITAHVNIEPQAVDRALDVISLTQGSSTPFIQIVPDWTALPPELLYENLTANPVRRGLFLPEGQRIQGSVTWSFSRGD